MSKSIHFWRTKKIVANELSRLYLDTTYDDLMPGGVIAIQKPGESLENVGALLEIQDVTSTARTAYGLSGKTTALTVKGSWYSRVSSPADLAGLRNLTIHIQNELLALAEEPDTSNIEGNRIVLDQPYFFIQPGQKLMLVGREVAIPQVSGELITVKNAFIVGNTTELERNTTQLELERPAYTCLCPGYRYAQWQCGSGYRRANRTGNPRPGRCPAGVPTVYPPSAAIDLCGRS